MSDNSEMLMPLEDFYYLYLFYYLQFPRERGVPHGRAPGLVKRQKERGECVAQSLDCVFHRKQLRTG